MKAVDLKNLVEHVTPLEERLGVTITCTSVQSVGSYGAHDDLVVKGEVCPRSAAGCAFPVAIVVSAYDSSGRIVATVEGCGVSRDCSEWRGWSFFKDKEMFSAHLECPRDCSISRILVHPQPNVS
jgi:hypothetical protein